MAEQLNTIELMETCNAVRRLKPDAVPQELLERVVYAATRAPSPGNSQGWDFVIVRDAGLKKKIRDLIAPPIEAMFAAITTESKMHRMLDDAKFLVQSLDTVPALIFVCGPVCYPPQAPQESFVWSTLYPATQNLLVAARSLGLGTTMTTFQMVAEKQIRELLGMPQDIKFAAMVPIGWPARPFERVKRKPMSKVIHWDKWSAKS
ncbi:MAG: nitroreductase family protein [Candidatus Binatus sp.]|uniref:nitroreductase family protein n=1 Tax=Candidatus Binatus sp. TaxID=2811406 RepID=UPI00271E577E|nr:nitroreductase family protein [Candidatus Binatus sp.]MDO8434516.1 nitroreductase family protein [Candidatus Binatus sp.]